MNDIELLADELLRRLFPICRSITGSGVRKTFDIINEYANFELHEVSSGTKVFDWTIPPEWKIRDAFIADQSGRRLVDFRTNNLHIVGYSKLVDVVLDFGELRPHLYTLPDYPEWIPHRTGTYADSWGFCISQQQLESMNSRSRYRVVVDSELFVGSLTMGDSVISGESGKEFLISSYCCHPAMANDNTSGLVMSVLLHSYLREYPGRRHAYRFVIAPETIGAIAYLALNSDTMRRNMGGFVLTCVGGPGPFGYKETFKGDHLIDRAVKLAFRDAKVDFIHYPFEPNGSDERQFASPGFRIPTGTITKDKYYEFKEYHTSADNLEFVRAAHITETYQLYSAAIEILEKDRTYRSSNPCGEPQLGPRGLYNLVGGAYRPDQQRTERSVDRAGAIGWIMFMADGTNDLMAIAERSGIPFGDISETATVLAQHGLLEECCA